MSPEQRWHLAISAEFHLLRAGNEEASLRFLLFNWESLQGPTRSRRWIYDSNTKALTSQELRYICAEEAGDNRKRWRLWWPGLWTSPLKALKFHFTKQCAPNKAKVQPDRASGCHCEVSCAGGSDFLKTLLLQWTYPHGVRSFPSTEEFASSCVSFCLLANSDHQCWFSSSYWGPLMMPLVSRQLRAGLRVRQWEEASLPASWVTQMQTKNVVKRVYDHVP